MDIGSSVVLLLADAAADTQGPVSARVREAPRRHLLRDGPTGLMGSKLAPAGRLWTQLLAAQWELGKCGLGLAGWLAHS